MRKILSKLRNQAYAKYYSYKFKPLIIRENTTDMAVFEQIFVKKDYGFPIDFKPKFIIDGGANVGYASLFFTDRFPEAEIIAIEPETDNFQTLEKNTAQYKQIKCVKAGIWHQKGFLKINDIGLGAWGFMTEEVSGDTANSLPTVTIGDLLKNSKYHEIDILKLDVEGAEKEIFSSNYESWLGHVKVLIIELHERMKEGCNEAFFSAVKKYPFTRSQSGENIILTRRY
jgi:FkbM family methyltransferase